MKRLRYGCNLFKARDTDLARVRRAVRSVRVTAGGAGARFGDIEADGVSVAGARGTAIRECVLEAADGVQPGKPMIEHEATLGACKLTVSAERGEFASLFVISARSEAARSFHEEHQPGFVRVADFTFNLDGEHFEISFGELLTFLRTRP